jgi:hypothetical protein
MECWLLWFYAFIACFITAMADPHCLKRVGRITLI